MKAAWIVGPALLVTLMTFGVSKGTYAFHSGGTGECSGCHSMHSANATAGSLLLRQSDPSSVCLSLPPGCEWGGTKQLSCRDIRIEHAGRRGPDAEDPGRRLRLAEEELHVHGGWRDDAGERLEPRPQHRRRRLRLRRGLVEHDGPRRHLQRIRPRLHIVPRPAREVPAAGRRRDRHDGCADRRIWLLRHEPRPAGGDGGGRRIACWPDPDTARAASRSAACPWRSRPRPTTGPSRPRRPGSPTDTPRAAAATRGPTGARRVIPSRCRRDTRPMWRWTRPCAVTTRRT